MEDQTIEFLENSESILSLFYRLASLDQVERCRAACDLLKQTYICQQNYLKEQANKPETPPASPPAGDGDGCNSNWEAQCHSEVAYTLKRLIKGLTSSRDGARQGFSVALTEILNMLDFLTVKVILNLIEQNTQVTGSMKSLEERDQYFGRVCGYSAIIQSGILRRDSTTFGDVSRLSENLIDLSKSKSYLQPISFQVLISLFHQFKGFTFESKLVELIAEKLFDEGINNPETLAIAVAFQRLYPTFNLEIVGWSNGLLLHPDNLEKIEELLIRSSSAFPKVHMIWGELFRCYFNNENQSSNIVPFSKIWKSVFDDSFMNSTLQKKCFGLLLFEKSLPLCTKESISSLLTPNYFLYTAMSLQSTDQILYKAVKKTMSFAISFIRDKTDLFERFLLSWTQFYIQNPRFEKCIKNQIVDPLLQYADEKSIMSYSKLLQEGFIKPVQEELSTEDEAELKKDTSQAHRQRYLDQLLALVRNPKIPKKEEWISDLVKFIISFGFFKNTSNEQPNPSLSEGTVEWCQDKLRAILCEFLTLDILESKKFISIVVETFNSLKKNSSLELIVELSEEDKSALIVGEKLNKNLLKKLKQSDKLKADERDHFLAIHILLLNLMVLIYLESEDIVSSIEELQECFSRMSNNFSKKAQENVLAPADVLLDMLFSFLSKPSNLFRHIVDNVFSYICQYITPISLKLFIEVLSNKEGDSSNEEDLFEVEGEEMDLDNKYIDAKENQSDSESECDDSDQEESDGEDEDDEDEKEATSDIGDEDMGEFDAKLAEIFKQKKMEKTQRKVAKRQIAEFKFKVIDLLTLYCRKVPCSILFLDLYLPLLQHLSVTLKSLSRNNSEEKQRVYDRLYKFYQSRLVGDKVKHNPELKTKEDVERAYVVLEELYVSVHSFKDRSILQLASRVNLSILKSLHQTPSLLLDGSSKATTSPNVESGCWDKPRLIKMWTDYTERIVRKGKNQGMNPLFLQDFISRFPQLALDCLTIIFTSILKEESKYSVKAVQFVFEQVVKIAVSLPKKECHRISRFIGLFHDCLTVFLQRYEESKVNPGNSGNEENQEAVSTTPGISKVRLSDINRMSNLYINLYQRVCNRPTGGEKKKLFDHATYAPAVTIHVLNQVLSRPDTSKAIAKRLKTIRQIIEKS